MGPETRVKVGWALLTTISKHHLKKFMLSATTLLDYMSWSQEWNDSTSLYGRICTDPKVMTISLSFWPPPEETDWTSSGTGMDLSYVIHRLYWCYWSLACITTFYSGFNWSFSGFLYILTPISDFSISLLENSLWPLGHA